MLYTFLTLIFGISSVFNQANKSLLKLALNSPLLMLPSLRIFQKITSIFTDNRYCIPSEGNSSHTLFCTELVHWSPAHSIQQETARRKVSMLVLQTGQYHMIKESSTLPFLANTYNFRSLQNTVIALREFRQDIRFQWCDASHETTY